MQVGHCASPSFLTSLRGSIRQNFVSMYLHIPLQFSEVKLERKAKTKKRREKEEGRDFTTLFFRRWFDSNNRGKVKAKKGKKQKKEKN